MADIFVKRELDLVKLGPKYREHIEKILLDEPILISIIRELKNTKSLLEMYQKLFDTLIEAHFALKDFQYIFSKYLTEEQKIEIEKEFNITREDKK